MDAFGVNAIIYVKVNIKVTCRTIILLFFSKQIV